MLQAEDASMDETGMDPLRVIEGRAQAIGVVAAGAIFVSQAPRSAFRPAAATGRGIGRNSSAAL